VARHGTRQPPIAPEWRLKARRPRAPSPRPARVSRGAQHRCGSEKSLQPRRAHQTALEVRPAWMSPSPSSSVVLNGTAQLRTVEPLYKTGRGQMLELVPLRDRPDLRPQLFSDRLQGLWPEFMRHDPTADLYFGQPHFDEYLDHAFAIVDPAEPSVLAGRAFAV